MHKGIEFMKCYNCNKEIFEEQNVRFTPEVKGEVIEIILPCKVCAHCSTPFVDAEQMNLLRKASADKYRKDHNLLTSEQIIAYRKALNMSQSAFARYLSVGEASIKRWETCFIQDESQDEHLRLKCDAAEAELNFIDVYWKRHEPNIYNGFRKFNFQLFKNVVLFLISKTKESIIYLNKLHFYVDFLHFKKYGTSLTGAQYQPLKYGPCPDQYRTIYDCLVNRQYLKANDQPQHTFTALAEPDLSVFDDNERSTLEEVFQLYESLGVKKIYELAHNEKAYTQTAECSFIDYRFALELSIS
ncbi:MAG TPA: type II TA system antitoxin MqsA family protein [Chlamydiales bacterium]|nr:type II TA system antitoxin MqsA family protein [Chlamydiales bacterium]